MAGDASAGTRADSTLHCVQKFRHHGTRLRISCHRLFKRRIFQFSLSCVGGASLRSESVVGQNLAYGQSLSHFKLVFSVLAFMGEGLAVLFCEK